MASVCPQIPDQEKIQSNTTISGIGQGNGKPGTPMTPIDASMMTASHPKNMKQEFSIDESGYLDDYSSKDFKFQSVQPRFQSQLLEAKLHQQIRETKELPIDFFDIKLYSFCKKYNSLVADNSLSFDCIKKMHHIFRLKNSPEDLNGRELEAVNTILERNVQAYPSIYGEYRVCKKAFTLVSGLAIKYKAVSLYDFNYRQADRSLNVKLLDLEELNADLFTLECLWLATMVEYPPLDSICTDIIKQCAVILRDSGERLVNFMGSLNSECNFNQNPTIKRLVAAKNPKVAEFKKILPDFEADVIYYQRLKVSRGAFTWCAKSEDQRNAQALRGMVKDFAKAYIMFEQELIGNLLTGL